LSNVTEDSEMLKTTKLDKLLTLSPSAILKLDDKTFWGYQKAVDSIDLPMKKGEKRKKRVIDEGSLAKTELRTLKSLRKTRGQDLGDKVFHMWQWARRRDTEERAKRLKERERAKKYRERQRRTNKKRARALDEYKKKHRNELEIERTLGPKVCTDIKRVKLPRGGYIVEKQKGTVAISRKTAPKGEDKAARLVADTIMRLVRNKKIKLPLGEKYFVRWDKRGVRVSKSAEWHYEKFIHRCN